MKKLWQMQKIERMKTIVTSGHSVVLEPALTIFTFIQEAPAIMSALLGSGCTSVDSPISQDLMGAGDTGHYAWLLMTTRHSGTGHCVNNLELAYSTSFALKKNGLFAVLCICTYTNQSIS